MDSHLIKRMNNQKLAVTDAQQRPGKPCSAESARELMLLVKDSHHVVIGASAPQTLITPGSTFGEHSNQSRIDMIGEPYQVL